ncbi:MAG: hypothetical protein PHI12_06855 [Dehalococcoidales bacterium]|nr:hypothetical protein [Dehalococcoidales bacterium]
MMKIIQKAIKLDRDKILFLLAEANTKWFNSHSGRFDYREHLEFKADYIVKNYNKKIKK